MVAFFALILMRTKCLQKLENDCTRNYNTNESRDKSTDLSSDQVYLAKRTERILGIVRTLSVLYFLTNRHIQRCIQTFSLLLARIPPAYRTYQGKFRHTKNSKNQLRLIAWTQYTATHSIHMNKAVV